MSGIPAQNGAVLRPLLTVTRQQLVQYATSQGITWREDSSNQKDDYVRNRIRHHVVPALAQACASEPEAFRQQALTTLHNLQKAQRNYQWLLQDKLQQLIMQDANGNEILVTSAFASMPDHSELVRIWLGPKSFDEQTIAHICANIGKSGKTFTADSYQLTIDRHSLILSQPTQQGVPTITITPDDIMVRLGNGHSLFFTTAVASTPLQTEPDTILVPKQALIWPLKVRSWHEGDSFKPFGMGGKSQKVSDFLINNKLPITDKQTVRLLENGNNEIIWVLGLRSDERYRVVDVEAGMMRITLVG
jgi:tRNA(Ile)-lysidine synthase